MIPNSLFNADVRPLVIDMLARSLDPFSAKKMLAWMAMPLEVGGPPVPITLSQILDELIGRFKFNEKEAQSALVQVAIEITKNLDSDQLDDLQKHLPEDLKPLFNCIDTHPTPS